MISGRQFLSLFLPDLKVTRVRVYVFLRVSDRIKDFEVLWSIILSVAIDMVDNFIVAQIATKPFFHDEAVLANVTITPSCRMFWDKDRFISA
jgi:hypothetical protein